MLLVIFGAGASYDSVPRFPVGPDFFPNRPPLADELFDGNRKLFLQGMDCFPVCKPIIPLLQKGSGKPIEHILSGLEEAGRKENNPAITHQLAAIKYYLHYVLTKCEMNWQVEHHGITNYLTLVDQLERWRLKESKQIIFVTFNYDTMLEAALTSRQLSAFKKSMNDYISGQHYKIFKLHGSVNWGRETPIIIPQNYKGSVTSYLIENSDRPTQTYRVVNGCPMGIDDTMPMFPALAIPLEMKSDFECPELHLNTLIKLLPSVSKIICIGWRGTEQHFLKLLADGIKHKTIPTMIIAGSRDQAEATRKNMISVHSMDFQATLSDGGFTTLINRLDFLHHFLGG